MRPCLAAGAPLWGRAGLGRADGRQRAADCPPPPRHGVATCRAMRERASGDGDGGCGQGLAMSVPGVGAVRMSAAALRMPMGAGAGG